MDDKLPFSSLLENPIATLAQTAKIIVAGLMLGVFLPGLAFYALGTFSTAQILKKLNPEIVKRIDDEKKTKEALEKRLESLKKTLSDDTSLTSQDLANNIKSYGLLQKQIDDLKPHLYIAPMFPDPLAIVWPLFYISFLILLMQLAPKIEIGLPHTQIAVFICSVWLLYRWPSWLRNASLLDDAERKVFAGTNFDIDRASFFVQEAQTLAVAVLFSLFLMKWLSYVKYYNILLKDFSKIPINMLRILLRNIIHWQCISVFLALAFIPYTYFFWRYVVELKDQRYLPQAVIMQTMWGSAWLLASMPLLMTWYKWQSDENDRRKPTDSAETSKEGSEQSEEPSETVLESPLSMPHLTFSAVAALLAFISPILKAALHF